MCNDQMIFFTRNDLKLPQRTSPINFAVQRRNGCTSNAWAVRTEKKGDAYIYCRDNMKGQKVSLHASGKQHISFDEKVPGMKALDDRFMNQWWEPQYDKVAVPTLLLLFPPWGLYLNAEQRNKSRAIWNKNHILINGHDDMITAVSFVILDKDKTLKKQEGSLPSHLIGLLQMGRGKKLCVIASYETEHNMKVMAEKVLQNITVPTETENLMGDVLTVCLTGWSAKDSAYILPLAVNYTQTPKK